jgi:hypothetical protein
MISKFDHDSERFKIAVDLESKLLICQWLIDFFLFCRWHNDYLSERKHESNEILEEIIDKEIWNEDSEKMKVIFRNKNHSKSKKSQNLWLCQNFYISKIMTKFHLKEIKCSKTSIANLSRINEKAENSNQSNS